MPEEALAGGDDHQLLVDADLLKTPGSLRGGGGRRKSDRYFRGAEERWRHPIRDAAVTAE